MEILLNEQIECNWYKINQKYDKINRKYFEKFFKNEQKYLKMDKCVKICFQDVYKL